jgi:hypothetical protein
MKKLCIGICAVVGLALAAQASVVSWDGSSADITGLGGNIQLAPGAVDTVWSTSTLNIDSPGTQADFKAAMDQVQQTHRIAQINAGLDQIFVGGGGNTAQGKTDATSPFSQMIGFDTAAFAAADVLDNMAVSIANRNGSDTLSFRWFVQTATGAYVSGVVDTFTGTAVQAYTLADATAIEWFDFDVNANIGSAIGASAGTLALSNVDYAGVFASETWDSGTTNWRGVKVAAFSAEAIPEPATLGLFGIGALVALFVRRRIMM